MDRKNWITFALAATVSSSALAATTAPIAVQKTNSNRAKQAQLKNKKLISNKTPGESNLQVQPTAVSPVRPSAKPAPVAATHVVPTKAAAQAPAAVKAPASDQLRVRQASASRLQLAPPTGTSTAPAPKAPEVDKPLNWTVGLNNYYSGAAVAEPFAGYQPDPTTGLDRGATELTTHFILGLKLTKNITFTVNPMFQSSPNYREYNSDTDSYDAKRGVILKPLDPFLRIQFGSFAKNDVLNWSGGFRYIIPVTRDSRRGSIHQIRTDQNLSIAVAKSLSLDLNNQIRFYGRPEGYQPDATKDALTIVSLRLNPGLNYTINDTFGVGLSLWKQADLQYGRALTSLDGSRSYIEPSVTWNITKGLTIWPYMNFRMSDKSQYTTQWGAELYWSIL